MNQRLDEVVEACSSVFVLQLLQQPPPNEVQVVAAPQQPAPCAAGSNRQKYMQLLHKKYIFVLESHTFSVAYLCPLSKPCPHAFAGDCSLLAPTVELQKKSKEKLEKGSW